MSDPLERDNRLDYVFVRSVECSPLRKMEIVETRRAFDGEETPIVSDHFGVLASVRID
jgi:endonuclease/exonuclease/phosphatase family metal-dependent hydrolase